MPNPIYTDDNYDRLISCYFKLAFTSNSQEYFVDPQWSVSQFIINMTHHIRRDFHFQHVEIIHVSNGETGEAIQPSDDKLESIYGPELKGVCFYIRPIVVEPIVPIQPAQQCSICRNNEVRILFLPCSHLAACTSCGMNPTMTTCHICREPILQRIPVYMS